MSNCGIPAVQLKRSEWSGSANNQSIYFNQEGPISLKLHNNGISAEKRARWEKKKGFEEEGANVAERTDAKLASSAKQRK